MKNYFRNMSYLVRVTEIAFIYWLFLVSRLRRNISTIIFIVQITQIIIKQHYNWIIELTPINVSKIAKQTINSIR